MQPTQPDDCCLRCARKRRVDRPGDAIGCFPHWVIGEMGIAAGRLNVGVPKDRTDHRQCVASRQADGREAVPKIVQPKTGEACRVAHPFPDLLHALEEAVTT